MVKKNLRRVIIAAVSKNGIIGDGINIPWHIEEEVKHFKKTTTGHPIILGRKTFQSIGKSLPNRLNIVITKNLDNLSSQNLIYCSSVKRAYDYLRKNNYKKVFICGGARVYTNTIKHAEEMIISHLNINAEGDKRFPKINLDKWEVKKTSNYKQFNVTHYCRK